MEIVFVALAGPGDHIRKVHILSDMLVDVIGNLQMDKAIKGCWWHQPSTINVMVRNLLGACKEYFDWHFTIADFNYEGGYNGFAKELFAKRQKQDVSKFFSF